MKEPPAAARADPPPERRQPVQQPLFQAHVWLLTPTSIDGHTSDPLVFGTSAGAHAFARQETARLAAVKPYPVTVNASVTKQPVL